jgi:hypothetical protein
VKNKEKKREIKHSTKFHSFSKIERTKTKNDKDSLKETNCQIRSKFEREFTFEKTHLHKLKKPPILFSVRDC